jgi:exopolysaccharide production protein ExoZ
MTPGTIAPRQWAAFDGIRAIAVLLVFWVHFSGSVMTEILRWPQASFKLATATGAVWWAAAASWVGHLGVDVFFLLSGFLMCRLYVLPKITRQHPGWLSFLSKRFWRIYPAFFVCYLASVWFRTQHAGWVFGWPDFFTGLVFFNAWHASPWIPYAFVSWSLGYEAIFYLLIPLCAWLAIRWGPLRAALCLYLVCLVLLPAAYIRFSALLFGAVLAAADDERLHAWASRLSDAVAVLAFIGGMSMFVLVSTHLPSSAGLALSAGADALTRAGYVLTTLGCACLVLRAQWGLGWLYRACCTRVLVVLGRWSYSFYLWHTLALGMVMVWVLPRVPLASMPAAIIYAVMAFALSVLMACLSYRFIELRYFERQAHQKT